MDIKSWLANKWMGILIILVSLCLGGIIYSLYTQLLSAAMTECGCGSAVCPAKNPPIPIYLGITLVTLLTGVGVYFLIFTPTPSPSLSKADWQKKLKTLKEDEKRIYQLLMDTDGVLFQSDVVQKSGMNKVKVSRTLDLMESRGLLQRRRQGMANVVILKSR